MSEKICLKEAFRCQNKLSSLLNQTLSILSNSNIVTTRTDLYLKKSVCEDTENEVVVNDMVSEEYKDHIDDLIDFAAWIYEEKRILANLIYSYKSKTGFDLDGEVSLNKDRQAIANTMSSLYNLRPSEKTIKNAGIGYKFNADGDQVSYKCDAIRTITLNYKKEKAHEYFKTLTKESDKISTEIDRYLVEPVIEYDSKIDVNASMLEIFEEFCSNNK